MIITIGKVSLQIEGGVSGRQFVDELLRQLGEIIREIVERSLTAVLDQEVQELLGREWHERGKGGGRQEKGQCRRCGSQMGRDFRRNGHYRRYLDTLWGRLQIEVPQVKCRCGGVVRVDYQALRKRQRLWDDVERAIRESYGLGMSLRQIKAYVDQRLQSSVGLRALNERVRQIVQLVPGWRSRVLHETEVPPVVRVDGFWMPLLTGTGEYQTDRTGRRRAVKRGESRPVLVAQGVWPDEGREEMVAWTVGREEDVDSWEALLTQMYERGICAETGLQLLVGDGSAGLAKALPIVYWNVPFQRCIFHKLRNIWRALLVPEELKGPAARAYRRPIIRQAAQVWQASDAAEARRRQQRFCQCWREEQPKAVATMQRDFEQTLTFYGSQARAAQAGQTWPARRLRTTSQLEREFRAFRRRLSLATAFHSLSGLMAAWHQVLVRRQAERGKALPGSWQTSLEQALAAVSQFS